jgi:methionyl aminopeptidase
MIHLKSAKEIDIMRRANQIIAETRAILLPMIQPGITTYELDRVAEETIISKGAKSAFKGYRGYPATICVSINDEVVHGIPSKKRVLKEGDILGLDMGTIYQGYYGDSAVTVPVGAVSDKALKLMKVTEECLHFGIKEARPGARLYDIGSAVQEHAESQGFSVVRDFVGHGIGQQLHEDPQVPNYGQKGRGIVLQAGMTIAIEPMINEGSEEVEIKEDGWTAVTKDGKLSAHFEHSIVITENGPVILSVL